MHTTLCILIEMLTYQRNKYDKKKVRAIIRRTATKDESYFTRKFADFSVILSLVQNAENCEKVEGIFFYLYLFASQDKKVE